MTQAIELDGCLITHGPCDWQILQRNAAGFGSVTLGGKWSVPPPETADPLDRKEPVIVLRVVHERTGLPVSEALDWHHVETRKDGTWSAQLEIPAGGLYRIETGVNRGRIEWAYHGDTIHHLGVGDLWVIAGQSNAAGYGRGPVDDAPELGLHLLGNDEKWRLATHPLNDTRGSRHANREGCNGRHSPFLAFARVLKNELNIPIGLIQTALGGSPLKAWNPVEDAEAPLYKNLLHCIALAGGRIAGVAWYQGESDGRPPISSSYLERFGQFVKSLRLDLGQPDIAFVTTQLNRVVKSGVFPEEDLGWTQVREAQRQAARQLHRVAVVPASDLPLCDLIHISPAGNLILGQRLALAALELTDGKSRGARFPEIVRAWSEANGTEVVMEFAPVVQRLHSDLSPVSQFVVEDKDGRLAVTASQLIERNKIRLTLDRPLHAGAVMHGQWGINPPSEIYEIETNKPVLGFHAFPVSM